MKKKINYEFSKSGPQWAFFFFKLYQDSHNFVQEKDIIQLKRQYNCVCLHKLGTNHLNFRGRGLFFYFWARILYKNQIISQNFTKNVSLKTAEWD